jgi:mannose-6-phosphate isomerase-like protein (cupin superfamily)
MTDRITVIENGNPATDLQPTTPDRPLLGAIDLLTGKHGGDRRFVKKGWGWEEWITNDPVANYCLKRLFIRAGHSGSLHCHLRKDETLLVVSGRVQVASLLDRWRPGTGRVTPADCGEPAVFASEQSFRFRAGVPHQLTAVDEDVLLVEASTYHDEADVVRFWPGDLLPDQAFQENWRSVARAVVAPGV